MKTSFAHTPNRALHGIPLRLYAQLCQPRFLYFGKAKGNSQNLSPAFSAPTIYRIIFLFGANKK
jgi:hypothetical protein